MEEFAPIYSPQERILITIKWLVIGLAIFIAYNYLVKPHLVSLGSCNPENFADVQVAIYLLYVGIPALFFFVFSLLEGVRSVKIIKYGVSPLPSEKVFIKTKYVYGWRSRLKPILFLLITLGFLFMSAYCYVAAEQKISNICAFKKL